MPDCEGVAGGRSGRSLCFPCSLRCEHSTSTLIAALLVVIVFRFAHKLKRCCNPCNFVRFSLLVFGYYFFVCVRHVRILLVCQCSGDMPATPDCEGVAGGVNKTIRNADCYPVHQMRPVDRGLLRVAFWRIVCHLARKPRKCIHPLGIVA